MEAPSTLNMCTPPSSIGPRLGKKDLFQKPPLFFYLPPPLLPPLFHHVSSFGAVTQAKSKEERRKKKPALTPPLPPRHHNKAVRSGRASYIGRRRRDARFKTEGASFVFLRGGRKIPYLVFTPLARTRRNCHGCEQKFIPGCGFGISKEVSSLLSNFGLGMPDWYPRS